MDRSGGSPMTEPDHKWHDRSTPDAERYEWSAWPTIRAVVTRPRTGVEAGYQASIELYGRATPSNDHCSAARRLSSFSLQAVQPGELFRPRQLLIGARGQCLKVVEVSSANAFLLAARQQPLQRILAN